MISGASVYFQNGRPYCPPALALCRRHSVSHPLCSSSINRAEPEWAHRDRLQQSEYPCIQRNEIRSNATRLAIIPYQPSPTRSLERYKRDGTGDGSFYNFIHQYAPGYWYSTEQINRKKCAHVSDGLRSQGATVPNLRHGFESRRPQIIIKKIYILFALV